MKPAFDTTPAQSEIRCSRHGCTYDRSRFCPLCRHDVHFNVAGCRQPAEAEAEEIGQQLTGRQRADREARVAA